MKEYIISKKRKNQMLIGEDEISEGLYNVVFGGVILYGFLINILLVLLFSNMFENIDVEIVSIFMLVGGLISILIVGFSKKAIISFLGFSMLSISMGCELVGIVSQYEVVEIKIALIATIVIVIVMMILGYFFPSIFQSMGKGLFIILLLDVICTVIFGLIFDLEIVILSFIGVIIFSLYITYDWINANDCKKTINNAIFSACDLYLDILNLFLSILKMVDFLSDD